MEKLFFPEIWEIYFFLTERVTELKISPNRFAITMPFHSLAFRHCNIKFKNSPLQFVF